MHSQNMIQGSLVNGSLGKVEEFTTVEGALHLAARTWGQDENRIRARFGGRQWPLVRFTNGLRMLCVPEKFEQQNALGELEASREQVRSLCAVFISNKFAIIVQVPLILAWAMSIHKSQGQTIERVKVNLGRIFEKGQGQNISTQHLCVCRERKNSSSLLFTAYVALSRARSLEGLQVINFHPSK